MIILGHLYSLKHGNSAHYSIRYWNVSFCCHIFSKVQLMQTADFLSSLSQDSSHCFVLWFQHDWNPYLRNLVLQNDNLISFTHLHMSFTRAKNVKIYTNPTQCWIPKAKEEHSIYACVLFCGIRWFIELKTTFLQLKNIIIWKEIMYKLVTYRYRNKRISDNIKENG